MEQKKEKASLYRCEKRMEYVGEYGEYLFQFQKEI